MLRARTVPAVVDGRQLASQVLPGCTCGQKQTVAENHPGEHDPARTDAHSATHSDRRRRTPRSARSDGVTGLASVLIASATFGVANASPVAVDVYTAPKQQSDHRARRLQDEDSRTPRSRQTRDVPDMPQPLAKRVPPQPYSSSPPTTGVGITPSGIANHYDFIDGVWVYSDDWQLNGRTGAGPGDFGGSNAVNNPVVDNDDANTVKVQSKQAQYVAASTSSTRVLSAARTSIPESPTATAGVLIAAGDVVVSPVASATTSQATGVQQQTLPTADSSNYPTDLPDGWLATSRTEAYAVPLIIGVSVFLACFIFGLICVMVRRSVRARRRRKYGVKLQEEGRAERHGSDNASLRSGSGQSGSSRGSQREAGQNEKLDEKSEVGGVVKRFKRKVIARRWRPSAGGIAETVTATGIASTASTAGLRNRRKNVAKLFNRTAARSSAAASETVVVDGPHSSGEADGRLLSRTATRDSGTASDRNSLVRSLSGMSVRSATSDDAHSIVSVQPEGVPGIPTFRLIPPSNASQSDLSFSSSAPATPALAQRRRVNFDSRPQSPSPLSSHTTVLPLYLDGSRAQPVSSSALALQQQAMTTTNHSNDSYAVPLPTVGPPAYIPPVPPSPAYTTQSTFFSPEPLDSRRSSTAVMVDDMMGTLENRRGSAFYDDAVMNAREEKAALLARSGSQFSESSSISPNSPNDPFRQQRRYEHLYSSREGQDAENEQRTGAASGPSSSRSVDFDSARALDEARRVAELEEEQAVQNQRATLAGHIALDDKTRLAQITAAASAPSTCQEQGMPSAPFVPFEDDVSEDESQSAATTSTSHTVRGSMLPAPPRAVQSNILDRLPVLDEKSRLKLAEDTQIASLSSSFNQPSAPPGSAPVTPSAPPSAPVIDMPSAPPINDQSPSAPAFVPELDDMQHHGTHQNNYLSQNKRPFVEGII